MNTELSELLRLGGGVFRHSLKSTSERLFRCGSDAAFGGSGGGVGG